MAAYIIVNSRISLWRKPQCLVVYSTQLSIKMLKYNMPGINCIQILGVMNLSGTKIDFNLKTRAIPLRRSG